MQQIRDFLTRHKPLYHFFGHTGQPFSLVEDENNFTQSCKIKELEFENDGLLAKDSFVILDFKGNDNFEIEIISDKWINEYTNHSWEYL